MPMYLKFLRFHLCLLNLMYLMNRPPHLYPRFRLNLLSLMFLPNLMFLCFHSYPQNPKFLQNPKYLRSHLNL